MGGFMSSSTIMTAAPVLVHSARERAALPRTPLLVELVGLPGAGKTTLSARVVQRLGEAGYRAGGVHAFSRSGSARLARRMRFAAFCLRRGRLLRTVAGYGLANRPLALERLPFLLGILVHAFERQEYS